MVKAKGVHSLQTFEDTLSPKQFKVWKYLSNVGEASPRDIVKATNVLMPTVRQALSRLVKLGKIKRTGSGRATRYIKLTTMGLRHIV